MIPDYLGPGQDLDPMSHTILPWCQIQVKERDRLKVKSRQRKHNLNGNYNLMGFDTIEINLVSVKS